jgi:hypothetical protein
VPELPDPVVINFDVSGSMQSPVTVMVFAESDQTAIYQALSHWSPISKTLNGTKQARSVSVHIQPSSIGKLLHILGDTLEKNQPKKVRVNIEL